MRKERTEVGPHVVARSGAGAADPFSRMLTGRHYRPAGNVCATADRKDSGRGKLRRKPPPEHGRTGLRSVPDKSGIYSVDAPALSLSLRRNGAFGRTSTDENLPDFTGDYEFDLPDHSNENPRGGFRKSPNPLKAYRERKQPRNRPCSPPKRTEHPTPVHAEPFP